MTIDKIEKCKVKMHNRITWCEGNKFHNKSTVSMDRKASQLTICTIRRVLLYIYALTGCTNRKVL